LDRLDHRRGLHDHARPAAERRVVHLAMAVVGVVADVGHPDVHELLADRPAEEALAQRTVEEGGEERQDVDAERHGVVMPGISWTTTRRSARSTDAITSRSAGMSSSPSP